jgi:hypothetical protein
MASIRVTIRHGEAVARPEMPELWVQGVQIPPGEEKSFDLHSGEPFPIEARLTEEQEKIAKENEEADQRVIEGKEDGKKNEPSPPAKPQGFAASPAPKTENPPRQTESRSAIDSKEVKGEAPLKR